MPPYLKQFCSHIADLVIERLVRHLAPLSSGDIEQDEAPVEAMSESPESEPPVAAKPPKPKRIRPRHVWSDTDRERDFPPTLIKSVFYEEDGRVYHRTGPKAGQECASRGTRTASIRYGGYRFQRSHIVFALHHGRWPTGKVFHLNFDRKDDRIDNLRDSTHAEICRSARASSRNELGVKGVSCDKSRARGKRFTSRIMRNGAIARLGYFDKASEAHQAYCIAAAILHGDFNPASRIFPIDD